LLEEPGECLVRVRTPICGIPGELPKILVNGEPVDGLGIGAGAEFLGNLGWMGV
jgi:hypothetical protein